MLIGKCPICDRTKIQLTEHHVVEAPAEHEKVTISICNDCHMYHEKYVNYLRNVCGIDIAKT